MNTLEKYIYKNLLNPIRVMNALMDSGMISDNCVLPEHVADEDCARAIEWLEAQPKNHLKFK